MEVTRSSTLSRAVYRGIGSYKKRAEGVSPSTIVAMAAPTPDLLTRYHNEPRMRMVTLGPGAYDAYMCWGAVHGRADTILRSVEAFALSNRFTKSPLCFGDCVRWDEKSAQRPSLSLERLGLRLCRTNRKHRVLAALPFFFLLCFFIGGGRGEECAQDLVKFFQSVNGYIPRLELADCGAREARAAQSSPVKKAWF